VAVAQSKDDGGRISMHTQLFVVISCWAGEVWVCRADF